MDNTLVALGGLAAAVLAPWLGWMAAKRSKSGRIATTEAEQLWTANAGFQQAVLNEAQRLRDEVVGLRQDVLDAFNDSLVIRAALDDAKRENGELRADNHALRNRLTVALGGAEDKHDIS